MIAELLVPFVVLIFVSVPIAFSQGLASLTLMGLEDVLSGESFVKGITAGMNSFTLAAVPLFTFAGDIMGKGGISRRLLDLGRVAFDKITGGLGIVAIVACMFFAAISGTGSATVAAIGLIMIPVMTAAGYDKPYSASLVATAGTIGTIIPPVFVWWCMLSRQTHLLRLCLLWAFLLVLLPVSRCASMLTFPPSGGATVRWKFTTTLPRRSGTSLSMQFPR